MASTFLSNSFSRSTKWTKLLRIFSIFFLTLSGEGVMFWKWQKWDSFKIFLAGFDGAARREKNVVCWLANLSFRHCPCYISLTVRFGLVGFTLACSPVRNDFMNFFMDSKGFHKICLKKLSYNLAKIPCNCLLVVQIDCNSAVQN